MPVRPLEAQPEDVERFIRENKIDERAADALMTCPRDVQQVVLERASLHDTPNPSAALMDRHGGIKIKFWRR